MKMKSMQDERIVAQKRKIGSDTCTLLLGGLLISLLVQEYILNAPFSQYAAEFICTVGACIYIVIRNIIAGNDIFRTGKNSKKMIIVNSIVGGFTMCAITGIANYARYGEKFTTGLLFITLAITFVIGTVMMFLGFSFINIINQRKQRKITEELDKEENDMK